MQNSVRDDQAVVGQASSGIMGLSVSPWAMGRSDGLHILGNQMQESFHLRDGGVGLKTGFFTLAVLEGSRVEWSRVDSRRVEGRRVDGAE